jgi:hypothetical protein
MGILLSIIDDYCLLLSSMSRYTSYFKLSLNYLEITHLMTSGIPLQRLMTPPHQLLLFSQRLLCGYDGFTS